MEAASVPTDAATPEGGEATEQESQQPQGADLSPVLERLDELAQSFQASQPLLQQQQEPESEPRLGLQDVYREDEYGQQALDPQALDRLIDQRMEDRIQAHESRVNAIEQRQLDQEWDALAEEYPKLQDRKFAEEVGQEVRAFAQGRGVPALAADPDFVEMVYLAKEARDRAAREVPAGSGAEVHVEGSTVGAAEPEATDQDIARSILEAGGRPLFGQ